MNRRGQAIVEFALIALLLFTFVFAIIDFAYMFYVQLTMQHAVREGVRYAITHPVKNGDPRAALIDKIKEHAYGLYEKNANPQKDPSIREIDPRKANFSNYSGTTIYDTGSPDQMISVSLTYTWPLLTPILRPFFANGEYTFTVDATMKNELGGA